MPSRVSRLWRQRTGLHSCADSSPGHSAAELWARPLTLATTGISGSVKRVSDSALRSHARAGAMSAVWKAPATGIGITLRAPSSLAMAPARVTASTVPAMTVWPRRVVVGHPHLTLGTLAGRVDGVVVGAHDRCHRPGVFLGGVVHRLAPLDHKPHPFVEAEGAAGGEGGVLAQAVAGAQGGLDADPLDGVEDNEAEHERRQLGVGAEGELVLIDVQQQACDVPARHPRGLPDDLPGGVFQPGATHAGSLGSLTREGERQHSHSSCFLTVGSGSLQGDTIGRPGSRYRQVMKARVADRSPAWTRCIGRADECCRATCSTHVQDPVVSEQVVPTTTLPTRAHVHTCSCGDSADPSCALPFEDAPE